ncbi:MAG: baseplate J/gp47 family protein [Desulfovibrio sp.]
MNLNKGVVRGLLEIFCWGLFQLYQVLAAVMVQAVPKQSSEKWLDLHADQVELKRKGKLKARGYVLFERAGTEGNVPIPAGRIVRTLPDAAGNVFRFVTVEDGVLKHGEKFMAIKAEAEEYGQGANVTAEQICELVTPVNGVDSVTNNADWLIQEGADKEKDLYLARRYPLRWQGNNGVTKYAYESWALEVPGVVAVRVLDNHPRGQGTVDLVVKGTAGVPTAELLEAVRDAVRSKVPVNDDWLVKGPLPVSIDIDFELELLSGNSAAICEAVRNRIVAIFQDPAPVADILPIKIGEDLTRDRLVREIMAIAGIKRINWNSPAGDVAIAADGLAVLGALNITAVQAAEL